MTRKAKLPRTDSVKALAEFWDSHDLTDFEDELEEVKEPVFVRQKRIMVRLASGDAQAVRDIAESKGISTEDLISDWVRQRIARRKGGGRTKLPTGSAQASRPRNGSPRRSKGPN